MESTITLKSIPQRAAEKPQFVAQKIPLKKNNIVDITVYVDDTQHALSFSIPLSTSMIGSQRTSAGIAEAFTTALSDKFGKVVRL